MILRDPYAVVMARIVIVTGLVHQALIIPDMNMMAPESGSNAQTWVRVTMSSQMPGPEIAPSRTVLGNT
jgi:hypothetical protein